MSELDFRPKVVHINVAAGDSVSFTIVMDDITQIPNPVWSAQVRDSTGETAQDFTCTPTADGATVVLYPAQTRALFDLPRPDPEFEVVGQVEDLSVWEGRYDVQVAYDTGMTRTLMRGTFTIHEDVTGNG